MATTKKYEFSQNTYVVWNETHTGEIIEKLRFEFGEGPFHVARVREISDKCSCGLTKSDDGHGADCEGFIIDYFPHPQVLYLETIDEGEVSFCGIFFQPTKKKKGEEKDKKKTRKKRKL